MKIVVDTNVFVSGIFWRGAPFKVLEAWKRGQFRLVVSPPILAEYWRVVEDLSRLRSDFDPEPLMKLVNINAEMVKPVSFVRQVCADPDDDIFLETAVAAGAACVVSGDRALLKVVG